MHSSDTERRIGLDGKNIARVEGEGTLYVRVRGDEVLDARLSIFEAPRFFERLIVGREPDQVIDMLARTCGICPIAYQMTAAMAVESLAGVALDPRVAALRRLFYLGEWIQSHALHVFLLHAPDYLGYDSAIAMAADHRDRVEAGLRLKGAGNAIMTLLGGRAIHPVTIRVGGFSAVPDRDALLALRPALERGLATAMEATRWVGSFAVPRFEREPALLALRDATGYPVSGGRIQGSDGRDLAIDAWQEAFFEHQVPESTALVSHAKDGTHYLLGPTARVAMSGDRLHPLARGVLAELGLGSALWKNVFWSIAARTVELVHACAEALEIIDAYERPDRPSEPWTPRGGIAAWATEAPRGMIFHRYELDEQGRVLHAQVVPPTSQNQAAIEADLKAYLPLVLALPDDKAARELEKVIRTYDPCISCSTHFLDLTIDRT